MIPVNKNGRIVIVGKHSHSSRTTLNFLGAAKTSAATKPAMLKVTVFGIVTYG